MADERQGDEGRTGIFQEGPSAHTSIDHGCSSDELALYEGLEQLGRSSEQASSAVPTETPPQQSSDPGHHTSSNELISVEDERPKDQAPSAPQSEEIDEFGLPPRSPISSRMSSSPDQSAPATELDVYAEQASRQNPASETQNEVHSQDSSQQNQQLATANSATEETPDHHETELDSYEALRTTGDDPLRGGDGGPSTPSHHSHRSNLGRRTSSTTSGGNITSHISTGNNVHEHGERSGRNNSIVLPRWQPDAEVTYCPICSTQFSFFNRKHHCRKCGRVVCATCSQHRITIPHEFIVHPPQETSANRRPSLSQRDTEAASTTCGGTKVRLCNPCVPDPNILPPPPIRSPDQERPPDRPTYLMSGYGQDQYRITEETLNAFEAMGNQPSSVPPHRQRTVSYSTPVVHRPPFPESRFPQRTSSQHIRNTSYNGPHFTSPPPAHAQSHSQSYGAPPPYMQSNSFHPPPQPRRAIYNSGILNPSIRPYPRQVIQSLLNPDAPPPSAPRREIPEEDRCPICREDLVMIAENERLERVRAGNADTWSDAEAALVREKHVDSCFKEQASIISGRGRHEHSFSEGSLLASPATEEPAGPSSRRAPRRVYGLFPFVATEKDCIDDAECAICFEDFEPGAKMARLECFCRFHEGCVRCWWEKKPGMCPVHGHNMEGL